MENDKDLAIPLFVWTINLCCARYKLHKNDRITILYDSDVLKRVLSIRARVLGLLYQEIIPPDVELFSLAET